MTVGEKIKQYRKLRKLTQKNLAEKSGLSEISIRKYEAGDRIPKQEQLRKLAVALEVGDNYLYDVRLDRMSIDTVGDFMTLIFLLEEKTGLKFHCQCSDDSTADPESISLTFDNKKVKVRWQSCSLKEILYRREITLYPRAPSLPTSREFTL